MSFRPLSGLCLFRHKYEAKKKLHTDLISVPCRGYVYSDLEEMIREHDGEREFPSPVGVMSIQTCFENGKLVSAETRFPSPVGVMSIQTCFENGKLVSAETRFPSPVGVMSIQTNAEQ